MKNTIHGFAAICITWFFAACNGNTNVNSSSNDSTSLMANDTLGKMADTLKKSDISLLDETARNFISDAVTGGLMEIELGQMAVQDGKTKRVKDFGKMMVNDHTRVNNNLKSVAVAKSLDLPSSVTNDQKKEIDELSKKNGNEFDKAYVNMMIEDHEKDIADFRKAQHDIADNDIKNFITNSLPVLQKHLDSIKAIKAKM